MMKDNASMSYLSKKDQKTEKKELSYREDNPWMERLRDFRQFKQEHGHVLVPQNYESNKALGHWVHKQRTQYKVYLQNRAYTSLTKARIQMLNDVGFDWDPIETNWMKRYKELEHYVRTKGNSLVPRDSSPEYPGLGEWARTQRRQYQLFMQKKTSSISKERIQLLSRVGFEWNAREARWLAGYVELGKHMRIHGLGKLPSSKENMTIYKWGLEQNRQYIKEIQSDTPFEAKVSALSKRRKELLDLLCFPWPEVEFVHGAPQHKKDSSGQKRRKYVVYTNKPKPTPNNQEEQRQQEYSETMPSGEIFGSALETDEEEVSISSASYYDKKRKSF